MAHYSNIILLPCPRPAVFFLYAICKGHTIAIKASHVHAKSETTNYDIEELAVTQLESGSSCIHLQHWDEAIELLFFSVLFLSEGVLYGPLHNEAAVKNYEQAISDIKAQGGTIAYGGKVHVHMYIVCTCRCI